MEQNKAFKELPDNQKDLYIFEKTVITAELINILKEFYEVSWDYRNNKEKDDITFIQLVPHYHYLISFNAGPDRTWFYKNKIFVSKKQVNKFVTLNAVMPISFIDFIFLENEKQLKGYKT